MAKQNMEEIRQDKLNTAIKKICETFKELELNDAEIQVVTRSTYEAILQRADTKQGKENAQRYLTTAASTTAIIISIVSIIASLLK